MAGNSLHPNGAVSSIIALGVARQVAENSLSSGTTTSNVPEGTNLYFTTARARNAISALSPIAYNNSTGQISASIAISDVSGLQTTLNGKEPAFAKNTAFNKNFGTTALTVCQGNDSRLSDARTPLAHTHIVGNISGLQSVLDSKVVKNEDIFVNTTGLANMTADFRIQVNGYIGHKVGWRDLVAPFTNTSPGASAPTLVTLANGIRMYRFGAGDSMHASYHVDHDYAEGTGAYHHIHWFPETAMNAGDTVTWRIYYIVAKGHNQGQSLLSARNSFDVTYTSPIGGTIAGDHIVSEASDAQAYSLREPDTVILAEVELLSKTFAGNVFGIQADLHYLSDREVTVSKKPNFNIAI